MAAMLAASPLGAQTTMRIKLQPGTPADHVPVVVALGRHTDVRTATVTIDGREVPCQLDDLDRDGRYDELAFLARRDDRRQTALVSLYTHAQQPLYNKVAHTSHPARTYAQLMLRNPKVKQANRHDIYLTEIAFDRSTPDPYHVMHHHGVAFENELVAMRIYMDQRQTVDLYGKRRKGLELRQTQFYTTDEQRTEGYGDDVLWVGNTFGLGALRGWNGTQPTMVADVDQRLQRIVAQGPVRTIVEVEDRGWTVQPGEEPVDMTLRYTLYAGHRDVEVEATFSRDMTGHLFSTGVINVKGSEEIRLGQGLRGCWGTDYPSTDTTRWSPETVGLAIAIPREYIVTELPANKDYYGYVVSPRGRRLSYRVAYTSAKEEYGCHSRAEWQAWMSAWRPYATAR